jgi:hypothetical protein
VTAERRSKSRHAPRKQWVNKLTIDTETDGDIYYKIRRIVRAVLRIALCLSDERAEYWGMSRSHSIVPKSTFPSHAITRWGFVSQSFESSAQRLQEVRLKLEMPETASLSLPASRNLFMGISSNKTCDIERNNIYLHRSTKRVQLVRSIHHTPSATAR